MDARDTEQRNLVKERDRNKRGQTRPPGKGKERAKRDGVGGSRCGRRRAGATLTGPQENTLVRSAVCDDGQVKAA